MGRKKKILNMTNVKAYILNNCHKCDFQTLDVCEKYKVSKDFLNKNFRAAFNTSIRQYVINIRIERGYKMLQKNPKMKVCDVAKKCGMNNAELFSKYYFRKYGTYPKGYVWIDDKDINEEFLMWEKEMFRFE